MVPTLCCKPGSRVHLQQEFETETTARARQSKPKSHTAEEFKWDTEAVESELCEGSVINWTEIAQCAQS